MYTCMYAHDMMVHVVMYLYSHTGLRLTHLGRQGKLNARQHIMKVRPNQRCVCVCMCRGTALSDIDGRVQGVCVCVCVCFPSMYGQISDVPIQLIALLSYIQSGPLSVV